MSITSTLIDIQLITMALMSTGQVPSVDKITLQLSTSAFSMLCARSKLFQVMRDNCDVSCFANRIVFKEEQVHIEIGVPPYVQSEFFLSILAALAQEKFKIPTYDLRKDTLSQFIFIYVYLESPFLEHSVTLHFLKDKAEHAVSYFLTLAALKTQTCLGDLNSTFSLFLNFIGQTTNTQTHILSSYEGPINKLRNRLRTGLRKLGYRLPIQARVRCILCRKPFLYNFEQLQYDEIHRMPCCGQQIHANCIYNLYAYVRSCALCGTYINLQNGHIDRDLDTLDFRMTRDRLRNILRIPHDAQLPKLPLPNDLPKPITKRFFPFGF